MNGYIADNLFQYAVARLIAEELGFALRCSHSRMHPEKNIPQLQGLLAACADAPLALDGAEYDAPEDFSAHIDTAAFDGYRLDLDELLADTRPRRLEVRGYFQYYPLLRPYKSRIREWFAMTPDTAGHAVGDGDVALHIRRDDLVVYGLAMSLGYYTELLERLDFRRLYVCGIGVDEEVRRALAPFDPVYVEGEPVDDFRFMLAFERLFLSNSGFAWWAGFLSRASAIYAPVMAEHSANDHPKARLADLRVDDEPRYHYTEAVPYMERAYTLRDIYAARGRLHKRRILTSLRDLAGRRLGLR